MLSIFWALLGLSLFTSKSGITFFGTALVIWSFLKIDHKKTFREAPWVYLIASFFPVALLFSFFSLAGTEAVIKVVQSWPWALYVFPFYLLLKDKKNLRFFIGASLVGFLAACGKALVVFGTDFSWSFSSLVRVASFWDIGRWAYFLACLSVISFGYLGSVVFSKKASKSEKLMCAALLFLSLSFLVLANSRGPWLGAAVGIAVLGISDRRYFKLGSILTILAGFIILLVPGISDRIRSSFSAKKENGVITSTDASNAGRLHMWKVNGDFYKENLFFGTGFESAEKPLREFVARQDEAYVKAYIDPEFSFRDQHDSYLWILVQMGLLFSVFFWGVIGALIIKSVGTFIKTKNAVIKLSFAVLVAQLFMFIFYSAVSSYEMLWFFPFLLILAQKEKFQYQT